MKYLIPLSFLICISFHINALEPKPDHWKEDPNFLLPYKNIQEAVCPHPERNITIRESGTLQYIFSGDKKIFECAYRDYEYSLSYCNRDREMMCRYQNRDEIIKRASSLISQADIFKEQERINVRKIRRQIAAMDSTLATWKDQKNSYLINSLELQTMELAQLISEDYLKNLNLKLKGEYDIKRNIALAEKKAEEERIRQEQEKIKQEQERRRLEQVRRAQEEKRIKELSETLSLIFGFCLFLILFLVRSSENATAFRAAKLEYDENKLKYEEKKSKTLNILKKRARQFNSFIKTLGQREKVFCLKCHSTDLSFKTNTHSQSEVNIKKDGTKAKIKTGRTRIDSLYRSSNWECNSCKAKIITHHANVPINFYKAPLGTNQYYDSIEVNNAEANIMRFAEQGIIPRSFESPWPSYEVKNGKFIRKNEYLYPGFPGFVPPKPKGVFLVPFFFSFLIFGLIRVWGG